MTKIINAFSDGGQSIADSLKSLGDSYFGNVAQQSVVRETARGKKRENDSIEPFAAAARDGDPNALAYYGAMANKTGRDAADFNLLSRSNHATGIDDPRLATAQIGAHEGIGSTAVGQGRQLANTTANVRIQADSTAATQRAIAERQAQQQQWTDEHTLVNLRTPSGKIQMVPKSQVADLQAHGYDVIPSLDNVKAGMFAPPQGQPGAQPAAGGAAPAAPSTAALNPDQRTILGLNTAPQSYLHPSLKLTGVSQDNGQTITLPDGRRIPLSGSGFVPGSHEAALGQENDNNVRNTAAQPLPSGNPATSTAASDASATSGIPAAIQKHTNTAVGAVGLGPVLQSLTSDRGQKNGSPEVAPAVQRAQSSQDVRNQQARSVLLASPGRQSVQAQKWVQELLPDGDMMANPATEAAKVGTVVKALKFDYDQIQQQVKDPNMIPAERQKLVQQLHAIERTVALFTQQTQGPAAAPQSAPQQSGGDPLAQARDAIAKGAPRDAVVQRLQQNGINPAGL